MSKFFCDTHECDCNSSGFRPRFFGDNHDCGCNSPYDKDHCQFGIWAPWYHSPVENTAFNLYAMSVEEERENQENEDVYNFWN